MPSQNRAELGKSALLALSPFLETNGQKTGNVLWRTNRTCLSVEDQISLCLILLFS